MISVVILTSGSNRHKYFVNNLSRYFKVLGVVSEKKRPITIFDNKEENEISKKHFFQRDLAESLYFKDHDLFCVSDSEILNLENTQINSLETFDWVKSKNPDFVILFGTSIIRAPLLTYFENKIINMHLGLSPYYRGSGTNFWPLVNNQPECIGATIHLAILKVDAGAILAQVRPLPVGGDNCHDLGCKTIIAGTHTMINCINLYNDKKIIPTSQNLTGGFVYKKSDFNPSAVLKMWENFENGMIKSYITDKDLRDRKYPIINL